MSCGKDEPLKEGENVILIPMNESFIKKAEERAIEKMGGKDIRARYWYEENTKGGDDSST